MNANTTPFQPLLRRLSIAAVFAVGAIGCGESASNDGAELSPLEAQALEAEALRADAPVSMSEFDLEQCQDNLLVNIIDQETRGQACERIDQALTNLQDTIAEYEDDHLIGIGGMVYTDACAYGVAALYAEEELGWTLKEYAEYPVTGACDGSGTRGVGAVGVFEYSPSEVQGEPPTLRYGYAAIAAGPNGLVARVRLVRGRRITLIVPRAVGVEAELSADERTAVEAEAERADAEVSMADFDLEHCKDNLLVNVIDQETRDQACERIDQAVATLEEKVAEYEDDHLIGVGAMVYTDVCVYGVAALYAEEELGWELKEFVEYPAVGDCDGSARRAVGAAGIFEYVPSESAEVPPEVRFGYAALAAGPNGLVARVRLMGGDRATLIVPRSL